MAFKEVVLLLIVYVFKAEASFSLKNCDHSAPIQIRRVTLTSGYPVQIKPRARISATGTLFNSGYSTTAQSQFKVHLHIEKKIGIGWFSTYAKIPCRNHYGSCTYQISCYQMPGCPWKTGQQTLSETATVPANFKIPGGFFGKLLGSGFYKFRADLRDADNQRVGCVNGKVRVKL